MLTSSSLKLFIISNIEIFTKKHNQNNIFKKYKLFIYNCSLSGLINLKKLFNSTIDILLEEIKEQHESKVEELNELIITSSELLRQRDKKINELEAVLKEKTFNEENYNRVSIIQNLNKQIKNLTNENNDLKYCLNRKNSLNSSLGRYSVESCNNSEVASVTSDRTEININSSSVNENTSKENKEFLLDKEAENVDKKGEKEETNLEEGNLEEDNFEETNIDKENLDNEEK